MVRRVFSWVILIPLLVVLIVFSVNNKDPITLSLHPLPYEVDAPPYILVMLSFLVGFLVASVAGFFTNLKKRIFRK